MSTEFQSSTQTLNRLHEEDQQKIAELKDQLNDLRQHLETLQTLFSVGDLKAVRERAKLENLSVDAWLKDIVVAAIESNAQAIYVEERVYNKLLALAQARNIDLRMLLTRASTTEFLLSAIQNGRL